MSVSQNTDLSTFLEQQIQREENCVSMYTRFAGIASDPKLRSMFHEFAKTAQDHRDGLRSLVTQQGVFEDGVIQNRITQEAVTGSPQWAMPPVRGRDEDMIADSLLSMRALSESYRSALRMVSDESVAAALIGMRQEEDRQKEQLGRYLHERT